MGQTMSRDSWLRASHPQCGPRTLQTFSCHSAHAFGILAPRAKGAMCGVSRCGPHSLRSALTRPRVSC